MCKRILIVDDEKSIREFVTAALAKQAGEIVEAGSGEEGFEKVMQGSFDLIITDNRMSAMSGTDMVSRIRRIPGREYTPVILLSGDSGLTCEMCNVEAIICKPFRLEVLRATADLVCNG